MKKLNSCPICDSVSLKTLQGKYTINPEEYHFLSFVKSNPIFKRRFNKQYFFERCQCLDCEHIFEKVIFDPEDEIKYHTHMYTSNKEEKVELFEDYFSELDIMLKELDVIENLTDLGNVLDIGSSFGDFCVLAKTLNIDISGFDICHKANAYLMRSGINCYTHFNQLRTRFKVIRVSHVLSHIHNDIESFIGRLIDFVDFDGFLYFIDHNARFFNIEESSPLWHVNVFSQKSFDLLLSRFNTLEEVSCNEFQSSPYIFKIFRRVNAL